ncbi:glycosyl hydrolase 108 family protein [Paraburkholderia jirisanensis]
MSSFDDAFTALIGNEGGYSNNPADPGGETMWGVTARVARSNGYTGAMKDLPLETAKQIAKKGYWDPYRCDQFDPRVGFQVFDAAYNGGHPAQWLQQAANVEVDGDIGDETVAAVRAADPMRIIARFVSYRIRYWTSLKDWSTFGRGWANRAADNLERSAS